VQSSPVELKGENAAHHGLICSDYDPIAVFSEVKVIKGKPPSKRHGCAFASDENFLYIIGGADEQALDPSMVELRLSPLIIG
jgi:hypothetical protein